MRLKSIKLAGFKSFVDPTTVNFPSGTRYRLRYRLVVSSSGADDARKEAKLQVMHGAYGDFNLASVYHTEFVYTGM